jgi:hypothetical protein
MTLSTNDNFANRELSIDELETIAAGGFWGTIANFFEGPVGLAQLVYNALDLGKPGTVYASGAHKLR